MGEFSPFVKTKYYYFNVLAFGDNLKQLTLFMYSVSRSWSACLTALHSCTILSLRSSLVQEESAIRAAPLMMLSRRSSNDGLVLTSL